MITGGVDKFANPLNSSEIINIDEGTITKASPINSRRSYHGMCFVTINCQEKLVIFGGEEDYNKPLSSIEIYNTKTEKWETSLSLLNTARADFDFLTVKFGLIQQL